MIAIIDYGVGNLFSLGSSLAALGARAVVTGDPSVIRAADKLILPGVGAFADAAALLRRDGLDQVVRDEARRGKPLLGICLGMQLLLEQGREVRPCPGLGVIRGTVDRIPTQSKLPHIGWNSLRFFHHSPLFRGLDEGAYVYFVHSFSAQDTDPAQVIAATDYGPAVTAAVSSGNFYGTQFHPEKSGEVGLTILRNFAGLNC